MENPALEQWICQDEQTQVALLSAPVTFPPIPSIALSIFKSTLKEAGISSKVIYGSFPAIHLLGTDAIYKLANYMDFRKNSEYLFARLTDVSACVTVSEFINTFVTASLSEKQMEKMTALVNDALKAAEEIVDTIAQRILHMGTKIVAASSIYYQQTGSLAVFKRLKELNPSIITLIGGQNVSGEMGMSILRNFPSVDYVSFGEGDENIAQFCKEMLSGNHGPLPYGIVSRNEPFPDEAPYRMTQDMNAIAVPDYSDFFEEIRKEAEGFYGEVPVYYLETYENTVFLEGSRGCWWGAKKPCSFCGLNGLTNVYREKTPKKLYEEIREVSEQYPGLNIQLSDNVLSQNMIRELLPMLAGDSRSYHLFVEVKTNLRDHQVKALADAGFEITQPGVESLNDHLLKLMGKGATAVQNLAFLKYSRSYLTYPVWNLMTEIPGEEREDYKQMLDLFPLVQHLNPPTRANPVMYMRFSRYCSDPEQYGLELQPDPIYRCCFKDQSDISDHIGIYYELTGGTFTETRKKNKDLYRLTDQAVRYWRYLFYSDTPPMLVMKEADGKIEIYDTRPCAPEKNVTLSGLDADIYRLSWDPVFFNSLRKNLPEYPEEEIQKTLDDLIRRKLLVFLSGKYLALAVCPEDYSAFLSSREDMNTLARS